MELIFLALCFITLALIYFFAENRLLLTRKYKIRLGTDNVRSLKIVQISDIHKSNKKNKIISRTKQLKPDIILLTGDMISRSVRDMSGIDNLTRSLSDLCPVYACPGNHELDLPSEIYEEYKTIMQKNGVIYLENRRTAFERNGVKINIAGASLRKSVYRDDKGGYKRLHKYTSEELEEDIGPKAGFTLLLAHNPLCAKAYSQWGADIVFCGHIHGGAVRLPLLGGLLSPERKFLPEYSKGIYRIGKTEMIVSGGIGKPRLFNPPEIVFCELIGNNKKILKIAN